MWSSILDTITQLANSFAMSHLKGAGGQRLRILMLQSDYCRDLEVFKTVCDFLHITPEEARQVFIRAASLAQMQWLAAKYPFSKKDAVQACERVCTSGCIVTARWLVEHFQLTKNDLFPGKMPKVLLAACVSGCLELAEWLIETYQLTLNDIQGFSILILESSADPEFVEDLISHFNFERCDLLHCLRSACARGHLYIAKLLAGHCQVTPAEIRHGNTFLRVARDSAIREWLLATYYADPPPTDPAN